VNCHFFTLGRNDCRLEEAFLVVGNPAGRLGVERLRLFVHHHLLVDRQEVEIRVALEGIVVERHICCGGLISL